jgi:hypothetical protein
MVRELLQQEQTDEVKSLGMTFRTLFKSFQEFRLLLARQEGEGEEGGGRGGK